MQKSQHTQKYQKLLKALRTAREQAGLTQLDVAARLGVYASYVSKCESGERRLDVVETAELCYVYKISFVELIEEIGLH